VDVDAGDIVHSFFWYENIVEDVLRDVSPTMYDLATDNS
jgi:hypothetical protein